MKSEAGFTLVEVLAALLAGGLLLAALGWAIGGLNADLQQTQRDSEVRKVAALAPLLTQLLEGAVPPRASLDAYSGDVSGVSLTTTPPDALGAIGSVKMKLAAVRTANGQALDLQLQPVDFRVKLPPSQQEQRLADGFDDIRFEYDFSQEERPRLPKIIKILFKARSGRTLIIVAEPRLTSDGSCRFDPISMACRS